MSFSKPLVVPEALAVNKEIAAFREQCVALIGMVDDMRSQVSSSVYVPLMEQKARRLPAKKRITG